MAEIALWQGRASVLNVLSEQLDQPVVKKILEVMTKADSSIVQTLEGAIAALTKYRMEANDSFFFLSTLKRNFMVSCTFYRNTAKYF